MKIIVTGFAPFLNNDMNPTLEVVRLLPRNMKGHQLIPIELPVLYDESFKILQDYIEKESPDVVICLGLAQGRTAITPERIAINLDDSRGQDNNGTVRTDREIIKGGKNALYSTLPIKEMVTRIQEKKIPAQISNTAGLYVCNNIMYNLLHYIESNELNIKAGFIHVPLMDEQTTDDSQFSLPIHSILEGVIDAIKACF